MSWRGKEKSNPGRTFQAPPGFRDSEAPALNAGEVVASTYQVRQPVARTENGQVFEAWDMLMERPVAIKVAWRDPGTTPLIHEARRCAAVRDEIAADVHLVGNHRGVEYVVAERLVGRPLHELLAAYVATGALMPPGEVLDVLRRTARGMVAAHAAGMRVVAVPSEITRHTDLSAADRTVAAIADVDIALLARVLRR